VLELALVLEAPELERQELPLGDLRDHPDQLLLHELVAGDRLADWTEFTSLINTNKTQPFTSASLAGLETAVSCTSAAGDEQATIKTIPMPKPTIATFLNIVSNIFISP
jgi:hypothetical protein